MAEKKHSSLALLDILTEYTDEEHVLTAKELMDLLSAKYNLNIERRTLYSNINILKQAGYVISDYEDNGRGYYLEEKQFDKAEVLMLCNAIHASHFISHDQSNKLIKKLLKTQSKYEQSEFMGNIYLHNDLKTSNKELLYNLRTVSEAIRDGRQMRFTYMKYDRSLKLIPRRDEPYIVEPRYIVYSDTRAYLIATNPNHTNFVHYRLDRISKAIILEERSKKLSKDSDPYEYARNKLFMYAGDIIPVTLSCDEKILDYMVDTFGRNLQKTDTNDGRFLLYVNTSKEGAMFLAQQFLDSMEIIEPEDLRSEFRERIKKVLLDYEKN